MLIDLEAEKEIKNLNQNNSKCLLKSVREVTRCLGLFRRPKHQYKNETRRKQSGLEGSLMNRLEDMVRRLNLDTSTLCTTSEAESLESATTTLRDSIGSSLADQRTTEGLYNEPRLVMPRDTFWQWCEGACIMQANPELSLSSIVGDWKQTSRTTCSHCHEECFSKASLLQSDNEWANIRAMEYFVKSHVIVLAASDASSGSYEYKQGIGYVCYQCFDEYENTDNYVPITRAALWKHWDANHNRKYIY
jgi:hypothetical protein